MHHEINFFDIPEEEDFLKLHIQKIFDKFDSKEEKTREREGRSENV